jgi:hypothetical protein
VPPALVTDATPDEATWASIDPRAQLVRGPLALTVDITGEALLRGVPVLAAVADRNRAAFDAFAGEFGNELPPDAAALVAWCRARAGESAPT